MKDATVKVHELTLVDGPGGPVPSSHQAKNGVPLYTATAGLVRAGLLCRLRENCIAFDKLCAMPKAQSLELERDQMLMLYYDFLTAYEQRPSRQIINMFTREGLPCTVRTTDFSGRKVKSGRWYWASSAL